MERESGIYPVGEASTPEIVTPAVADEQWKFDEARRLMPQEAPEAGAAAEKLDPALVERIKAKQRRIAEMAARVDASMSAGDRDEHAVAMGARVDAVMARENQDAHLATLLKNGELMRARMTAEYHARKNAEKSAASEQAARAAVEEAADPGSDPMEKAA